MAIPNTKKQIKYELTISAEGVASTDERFTMDKLDLGNNYKPLDLLAYMLRFDARMGYYIYPEAGDAEERKLWLNRGSTYEGNVSPREDVCVTKHGFKIPTKAESYDAFAAGMKLSEAELRRAFSGY